MKWPSRPLRLVAINVGLLACGILLVLAGFEIYYRFSWTPPSVTGAGRYLEDQHLNHVFSPNFEAPLVAHSDLPQYTFKTNELGLRIEHPYSIEKPSKTKRIVFAGDSFVEGYLYERTLPARVERALKPIVATGGYDLQVIHAGVGTYSPMLHYIAFERKLLQLKPDAVLLAIDMTDAFDDYVRYQPLLYQDKDGFAVRSDMTGIKILKKQAMVENLSLTNVDWWISWASDFSYFAQAQFEDRYAKYHTDYPTLGVQLSPPHSFQRAIFDLSNPETARWVAYSQTWIGRLITRLHELNIPIVICMYPYQRQLSDRPLQGMFDNYERYVTSQGALFHSALPAFLAVGNPAPLYLRGDTHFSYAGQEVWAESLISFLIPRVPVLFEGLTIDTSTTTGR